MLILKNCGYLRNRKELRKELDQYVESTMALMIKIPSIPTPGMFENTLLYQNTTHLKSLKEPFGTDMLHNGVAPPPGYVHSGYNKI